MGEDEPDRALLLLEQVAAGAGDHEVADEGAGFDLDACTVDSTSPENIEREDGRGLFLMRSLMDRVERFDDDARNVVRLTLRRS